MILEMKNEYISKFQHEYSSTHFYLACTTSVQKYNFFFNITAVKRIDDIPRMIKLQNIYLL